MSVHIVTKETIDAIVTFAYGNGRSPNVATCAPLTSEETFGAYVYLTDLKPSAVGQALVDENYRSVNYRYREADKASAYKFRHLDVGNVEPDSRSALLPIDIIKLCHCLIYQSCEHPGWETSWARSFLRDVVDSATLQVAGYEAAPWGLHEETSKKASRRSEAALSGAGE